MEKKSILQDKQRLMRMSSIPLLVLVTSLVLFLFFIVLPYVLPIVLGLLFALAIDPLVRLFTFRIKGKGLPRKVGVIIAMLLVFGLLGLALFAIVNAIVTEIIALANSLPTVLPGIAQSIEDWIASISQKFEMLPPDFLHTFSTWLDSMVKVVSDFVTQFAVGVFNQATSIPQYLLFLVVTFMATYFISSDKQRYLDQIHHTFPDTWLENAKTLYNTLVGALFGYIRAQLILMCVTFLELVIGFTVLSIDYAFLMAFIIAVLDALPIIGAGLILIPMEAYQIFTGDLLTGIGLIVLHVILIVVRQSLEPRVVGRRIGLPPLVTMASMYAGLLLFGFIGLIIVPISVLIILHVVLVYMNGRPISYFLS